MHKQLTIPLSLALLAILALVGVALAAGFGSVIDWQVIAGGGAPAEGGGITLNDTLGQTVIGPSSANNVDLSAGYWTGIPAELHIFMPLILR